MRSFSLLVLLLRLTGFFHSLPWGLSWSYFNLYDFCWVFWLESYLWGAAQTLCQLLYQLFGQASRAFPADRWIGSDRLRRSRSNICLISAISSGVLILKDSVMPWDKISLSHVNCYSASKEYEEPPYLYKATNAYSHRLLTPLFFHSPKWQKRLLGLLFLIRISTISRRDSTWLDFRMNSRMSVVIMVRLYETSSAWWRTGRTDTTGGSMKHNLMTSYPNSRVILRLRGLGCSMYTMFTRRAQWLLLYLSCSSMAVSDTYSPLFIRYFSLMCRL